MVREMNMEWGQEVVAWRRISRLAVKKHGVWLQSATVPQDQQVAQRSRYMNDHQRKQR